MSVMALAVQVILPGMVVTLDDDFWYLRSVVETIQKGRPWTDDWLTPWAASATGLSALIFHLTGSFTLAIHLQLSGAAGLAGLALVLFLQRQGIRGLPACSSAVLILLMPAVLFMFLMFTGVALYIACLWWCLLLADQRRWFWFLLPWGVALASRQSAIVWLALPGWELLQEGWHARRFWATNRPVRRLLSMLALAGGIFLFLKGFMNPTPAQKLIVGSLGGSWWNAFHLMPLGLGGLVWLAGWATASLIRWPWMAPGEGGAVRHRMAASVALGLAGAAGAWAFHRFSSNSHDAYYGVWSSFAFPALGALLGVALGMAGQRPKIAPSCAALGSILLVAMYGGRFEYYYYDSLCFGIAAGFPAFAAPWRPADVKSPAARWFRNPGKLAFVLTSVLAGLWHSVSMVLLTAQQNNAAALITLYEQSLRSGKLPANRVGMATFGYLGWLFQDYYSQHEGQAEPVIGGFSRYAQAWDGSRGTGIISKLSQSRGPFRPLLPSHNTASLKNAPGTTALAKLKQPHSLLGPTEYHLKTSRNTEPVQHSQTVDLSQYQRIPFPLTDEEWRSLIRTTPLPATPAH